MGLRSAHETQHTPAAHLVRPARRRPPGAGAQRRAAFAALVSAECSQRLGSQRQPPVAPDAGAGLRPPVCAFAVAPTTLSPGG